MRLLFCLVGSASVFFVGATAGARSISSACGWIYSRVLHVSFMSPVRITSSACPSCHLCAYKLGLCESTDMMQLGGKKLHRREKVNRCVFNFSCGWRTQSSRRGIFEWSRFEINVFLKKKKSLAVVMVQSQYQQKCVPGTKKWYHGTSVHFGNGNVRVP